MCSSMVNVAAKYVYGQTAICHMGKLSQGLHCAQFVDFYYSVQMSLI